MKNLKILTAFSALLLVFNASCDKESRIQNQNSDINSLLLSVNSKEVAEKHNEFLIQINNERKNHKDLITTLKALDFGIPQEQVIASYEWAFEKSIQSKNDSIEVDYHQLILNFLNTNQAKNLYLEIDSVISHTYNKPNQLKIEVDRLMNSKKQIIDPTNLKVIELFAETSKASSDYWFGVSNGKKHKDMNTKATASWVKADGRGAAGSSITWAVGAALATGPVAPVSYFVCVALGAALASIMS